MATGLVELIGTKVNSAEIGGLEATKANDLNNATAFGTATPGFWGYDFGVSVVVERIYLKARQETWAAGFLVQDQSQYIEHRFGDSAPTGSGDNLTLGDSHDDTAATVERHHLAEWIFHNHYNIFHTGSRAGRYHIVRGDGSNAFCMAEIKFAGAQVEGVDSKPIPPDIAGNRLSKTAFTIVTLSSPTTSATLHYTTDGTTPTSASTQYTAPFRFNPSADGTTLKVIAYDPTCSTDTSEVSSAVFYSSKGITPKLDWYDDRGILIEAHEGGITTFAAFPGIYFWYGTSYNRTHVGDLSAGSCVNLYTSTDLMNWTYRGPVCSMKTFGLSGLDQGQMLRWHPMPKVNPTTGKYVIWGFSGTIVGIATGGQTCLTADSPYGPWTLENGGFINPNSHGSKDGNVLVDDDGTGYLLYVPHQDGDLPTSGGLPITVVITKLNAEWTDVTTDELVINFGEYREGILIFKRKSTYFIVHGAADFYGDDPDWDLRYIVSTGATPIADAWTEGPGSAVFSVNPEGTQFNGQATHVFKCPNTPTEKWVLMLDDYAGPGTTADLYLSRYVWQPITFPTNTTMRVVANADFAPLHLEPLERKLSGMVPIA